MKSHSADQNKMEHKIFLMDSLVPGEFGCNFECTNLEYIIVNCAKSITFEIVNDIGRHCW